MVTAGSVGLDDPREETVDPVEYAGTVARVRARMFGTRPDTPSFGRHRVERVLGKGAMGRVYLAHDPELDRRVAIKQVRPRGSVRADAQNTERLRREAEVLARLAHPNVVEVYEVGQTPGGAPYVVMEHVDGGDLGARLEDPSFSWRQRLELLLQAGEGLAAAHEAGLIHRDVKPTNILVGEDGRARLADFGLAHPERASTDDGSSGTSQIDARVGTPAFMAPESLMFGTSTPASDQYAFGICVHLALTGQWPEASVSAGLRGRTPPADARRVPTALQRVVARAMAVDPAERFESVRAMLDALRGAAGSRRRNRVLLGTAVVGAVAIGALVASRPASEQEIECTDDRQLAVWNATAREALAENLGRIGSRGEQMLGAVEARIDEVVGAWGRARTAACVVASSKPSRQADLTLRCLDGQRAAIEALLDALSSNDSLGIDEVRSAVERFPDPADCKETELLERGLVDVTDPDARAELQSIAEDLAVLRLRGELEPPERLLVPADALVERARTSGHTWTLAGALEARAQLGLRQQETDALARLETAFHTATEAGNRAIAARAGATLAKAKLQSQRDQARRWLAHAQSNAEGTPKLVAQLAGIEAALAHGDGDCESALEASTRAVTEAGAANDSVLLGRQLGGATSVALQCHDLERAAAWATRSHDTLAEALGPEHVDTAVARYSLGQIASLRHDPDQAVAHLRAALEVFEAAEGGSGPKTLAARNGLGVVLAERDPVSALPVFTRALADAHEIYGDEHPALIALELNVAMSSWHAGAHAETLAHSEAGLRLHEALEVRDVVTLARSHLYRGRALEGLARFDEARSALEEALEVLGPDAEPSVVLGQAVLARGLLRYRMGEAGGADEARRGLSMIEDGLPADDPKAQRARARFAAAGLR